MIKPISNLASHSWPSAVSLPSAASLLSVAALLGVLALPACVTINIYFPAAAAEKAADKIIDDIWQLKEGIKAPPAKAPTNEPSSK